MFLFVTVDTANTGRGDLNIVVSDERSLTNIPVTTNKISHNLYNAEFTPSNAERYKIELEYNDEAVEGLYHQVIYMFIL